MQLVWEIAALRQRMEICPWEISQNPQSFDLYSSVSALERVQPALSQAHCLLCCLSSLSILCIRPSNVLMTVFACEEANWNSWHNGRRLGRVWVWCQRFQWSMLSINWKLIAPMINISPKDAETPTAKLALATCKNLVGLGHAPRSCDQKDQSYNASYIPTKFMHIQGFFPFEWTLCWPYWDFIAPPHPIWHKPL